MKDDNDDEVIFNCCECNNQFTEADGTWLPIGLNEKPPVYQLSGYKEKPPLVLMLDLREPEIITSDKFTCYDCIIF